MALQSFGNCPECGAWIEMKKVNNSFQCPVCYCVFRHNYKAWIAGFPAAVILACCIFQIVKNGLFSAMAGGYIAHFVVAHMGVYQIISEGRKDVAPEEVMSYKPERKESFWIIAVLGTIIIFSVWAIFYT